jgi:mannosyltransferase
MKHRLINSTTLLTVIIALGFGLRLFHLDAQSFWYDEAYSAEVAEKPPSQVFAGDFGDNHPPFHSIALHYWSLIGRSDFLLRLFSTIMGTLGIASISTLGRLIFDSRVGLLGAAIAAIAPYQVYYSQEVRMYSMLFLATTILLISYFRAVSTNSRHWWIACACSAIWGMYVQYWIVFVLLGLHLDLLLRPSKRTSAWPRLALVDLSVILAFAPWLTVFLSRAQVVARGEFWLTRPGLARLISAPYAFTLSELVSEKLVPFAFSLVLFLFIITHLQVARELARRGRDSAGLSLLLWTFWSPLLLTFIISQWRAVYLERTLMVAVPALYLLLAWGAARTRERYVNFVLLLLVALLSISALHNWYFDPDFGKPPFRTAAQFLQDEAGAGEPILHTSDGGFLIFLHYTPDSEHYLLKGDPETQLPSETYPLFGGAIIAKEDLSARRFWLVVALDNSIEFQTDLADWFDGHHKLVQTYDFDGVNLRCYDDTQTVQQ